MVSLRSVLGAPDHASFGRRLEGKVPRVILAVAVIAAGIVLGAGLGPVDAPVAGEPPPTTTRRDHASRSTTSVPDSPAPSTTTTTAAAVRIWPLASMTIDGRQVANDDGRWEVGADGDLVVVGDWDCDRLPTPAVLRPSTGEVAVFDRLAGQSPEPARPVATMAGASGLRPTERCGEVLVERATGDVLLDTRPDAP